MTGELGRTRGRGDGLALACAHGQCDQGAPLSPDCGPCIGSICAQDPFCCQVQWDGLCVAEVGSICGETCGECTHELCTPGEALDPACDPCVSSICAADPFCCQSHWDSVCVDEVETVCGLSICKKPPCTHELCTQAEALDPACDPCVSSICAVDPFCCQSHWDSICVGEVETVCGLPSCPLECAHDRCVEGGLLDPACDPCVASICAVDPFCCNTSWDAACVDEVETVCGLPPCHSECAHGLCVEGDVLAPACNDCVASICAVDPFCCQTTWDSVCVGEVETVCGLPCPECAHDLCVQGQALNPACDPCAASICAADPFCCQSSWDALCVDEVATVCGQKCGA